MGFTRNYAFLKYCECIQPKVTTGVYGVSRLKNVSGNQVPSGSYPYVYANTTAGQYSTMSIDNTFGVEGITKTIIVKVGNSLAPETFDDYTIAEMAGVSSSIATSTVSLDDNILKTKFIISIANTNNQEMTVNEVGILTTVRVCAYQNSTGNSQVMTYDCLIYRKKLDVPIIIAANGNASINLEVCHVY